MPTASRPRCRSISASPAINEPLGDPGAGEPGADRHQGRRSTRSRAPTGAASCSKKNMPMIINRFGGWLNYPGLLLLLELSRPERDLQHDVLPEPGDGQADRRRALRRPTREYEAEVKGFIEIAFDEVPRIPIFQPLARRRDAEERHRLPLLVPPRSSTSGRSRRTLSGASMLMLSSAASLAALPSIVGVVIVTFLLTRAAAGRSGGLFRRAGGEPAGDRARSAPSSASTAAARAVLAYLGDLAHGDLGNSLTTGQPVVTEICHPPAGLGRADPVRRCSWRSASRCRSASWRRCGGLLDRPSLPHRRDRRRVAAGVLHRAAAGLCLLLSAAAGRRRRSAGSTCSCRRRRRSPASI